MQCSLQGVGLRESPINISYPPPHKIANLRACSRPSAMPSYAFYRLVNKSSKLFFLTAGYNPSIDMEGWGFLIKYENFPITYEILMLEV